ncbi:hypothetical protein LCGC14_1243940 [marine sediment metagenome]|uniref:Uncharacterized protein n=1 Tax=marine sediment metagenome TaxID=412755 RepID=A0A0F9L518_9ZZZZ
MKMVENLPSLMRINKTYNIKYEACVEEISFTTARKVLFGLEDIESLKMEYSK